MYIPFIYLLAEPKGVFFPHKTHGEHLIHGPMENSRTPDNTNPKTHWPHDSKELLKFDILIKNKNTFT